MDTVWITVHGHCSQILFMDTVKKKYKIDPRNLGVTLTSTS